eukprot:TRINITY_DN12447_c0_g2_i2.p1 TRINITY_DN12447_c0_g2~~TRINITY_DN12447_c0_g2_i2.p1  ORF type:complete len:184 (+),score=18.99 TRINITY_DN12447_c0_g2_i2:160-711(+)
MATPQETLLEVLRARQHEHCSYRRVWRRLGRRKSAHPHHKALHSNERAQRCTRSLLPHASGQAKVHTATIVSHHRQLPSSTTSGPTAPPPAALRPLQQQSKPRTLLWIRQLWARACGIVSCCDLLRLPIICQCQPPSPLFATLPTRSTSRALLLETPSKATKSTDQSTATPGRDNASKARCRV